jgi:hypothetical protein
MRNLNVLKMALVLGVLVCSACSEPESPATAGVKLVISPSSIVVTDTGRPAKMFLTTEPSGTLSWQVAAKPDWLVLTPDRGRIDRRVFEVTLTVANDTRAEPGPQGGLLELVSDGGAARIVLQGQLTPKPVATVGGQLAISATVDTTSFLLRNTGRGNLQWQTQPSASLITTNPANGTIRTGDSTRVRISADKQPLPVGTNTGSVVIKSNSISGDLSLPLSVTVSPTPLAAVSSGRISLPGGVNEGTFVLTNRGKARSIGGWKRLTAGSPARRQTVSCSPTPMSQLQCE